MERIILLEHQVDTPTVGIGLDGLLRQALARTHDHTPRLYDHVPAPVNSRASLRSQSVAIEADGWLLQLVLLHPVRFERIAQHAANACRHRIELLAIGHHRTWKR